MGSGISFVGKSQKYSVQKLAIFEDKGEPNWIWADVHLLTTASLVPYHLASDWHGLNCGSGCNLHDLFLVSTAGPWGEWHEKQDPMC